ncbi:hypothetical protein [Pseudomonas viridiflava]|uniref:hypothetical protein n=1 Tax=Pseudomonas viridiflava TaxID=33069 RepID=UPI000F01DC00|nr:hypothetical protein [Pseudomonas viridiflava]
MTAYAIIENHDKPFNELFGDDGEAIQQDIIFSSQVHSSQRLPEGKWEYRRYANGAVALVCADTRSKIPVETNAGEVLLVSPEALSLSANLMVMHEKAHDHGQIKRSLCVMHQALHEAIIRDIPTILITSTTPEVETRKPNGREVRVIPHEEAQSIVLLAC